MAAIAGVSFCISIAVPVNGCISLRCITMLKTFCIFLDFPSFFFAQPFGFWHLAHASGKHRVYAMWIANPSHSLN